MGFFEDMFDSKFLFDSEYRQRADIEALTDAVVNDDTPRRVRALEVRVNQLQLLCNALVEVLRVKNLASAEEIEILVQRIDLLDGVEDGAQSDEVWSGAPRCAHCQHYVNPARQACIYCGRGIESGDGVDGPYRGSPGAAPKKAVRTATCQKCQSVVPQGDTLFTEDGDLWCLACSRGG